MELLDTPWYGGSGPVSDSVPGEADRLAPHEVLRGEGRSEGQPALVDVGPAVPATVHRAPLLEVRPSLGQPQILDQSWVLVFDPSHGVAQPGYLLVRELLLHVDILSPRLHRHGRGELPPNSTDERAENNDDDDHDDQDQAEDPHEKYLGSVRAVLDGGSHLTLEVDSHRHGVTARRNAGVLISVF